MASELLPIRLGVTAGDLYTLWAPNWRDDGDEWEAFLGEGEQLFGFASVADLAAFVRADTANDLAEHPAWPKLAAANAHRLVPRDDRSADLIAVEELLAEKPTEASVRSLAGTLAIVSSIGSVCELPAVTRFFNGNPNLGWVSGGLEQFTGRAGRKRWNAVGEIVARSWDGVVNAIDEFVTTPAVDPKLSAAAQAELDEVWEDTEEDPAEDSELDEAAETGTTASVRAVTPGSDTDFWEHVGIDPIRVMNSSGTWYTLRCYFGDKPVFLGRNGRISVFPSERALARYLADEHDHDLSEMSTYDDIRTAAIDGSLEVEVDDDNVYVLTGLVDDIPDGPEALDRDQVELVLEFIRDVGAYSEDDTVDRLLADDSALGHFMNFTLDPESRKRPKAPFFEAIREWGELERFVESRLRRE